MSIVLPPEFEQFIIARVSRGEYESEHQVLQAAFNLLEGRERLLAHIDEGTRQLRAGEFTQYSEHEIEKFLADVVSQAPNRKLSDSQ